MAESESQRRGRAKGGVGREVKEDRRPAVQKGEAS
jgi:hypothetical protein